jgi:DNA end-binding protein Ku
MARSIWTGVISFGLVSVPVKVFSATKDHDVSFHQFQKDTSDRIRYQRVNERTGKEVDYADIVKGAEVSDGSYVMLDADELESVAPGRSRSLDIHTFVDQADIDPIYYQKAYYLAPGSDETARTYALLRDAMADAGRVAIGTLVMRGKEYLAAIRADGALLVLETMYFADEIRDPDTELDTVPSRVKAKPQELKMAVQLIDSMTGPWKPTEFRDTYTDRVNDLIEAKRKGNEVTPADEAPAPTNVVDLMSALRASVEAAKQRRGGSATGTKATGSAKKASAGTKSSGSKKSASGSKKTTSASSKAGPAKKATSASKKAAPAKKSASASKKAAPAKKSASASKKAAPATKKAAPATKSATAKKAPVKKSAGRSGRKAA